MSTTTLNRLLTGIILCSLLCWNGVPKVLVDAATATSSSSSSSQDTSKPAAAATTTRYLPRRQGNIDFLDAYTLSYYLGVDRNTGERMDPPPPPSDLTHNVVVMFYAPWDRNSHRLATSWDAIATMLKAGTRKSNLIMGLFDCEHDTAHMTLCQAAGITHYPTFMFISPTRTFPHKPSLVVSNKNKRPLPHTTVFPGNMAYDKSILDWIRTMQMMVGWTAFWDKKKKKMGKGWWQAASYDPATANALPVGIPPSSSSSSSSFAWQSPTTPLMGGGSTGTSAGSSSSSSSADAAATIQELKEENKMYEELVVRASALLDATLFPIADPIDKNSTDLFKYLYATQSWDATDITSQVIRTCAMEVALDYCTRLTEHKTNELIDRVQGLEQQTSTLAELEQELKIMIQTAEPYCDSIEACIIDGFTSAACRSPTCPFVNPAACGYMSACFDESIQRDYAKAMGLELPPKTAPTPKTTTTASNAASTSSSSAGQSQSTTAASNTGTSSSSSSTTTTTTTTATEEAPKKKRGWF